MLAVFLHIHQLFSNAINGIGALQWPTQNSVIKVPIATAASPQNQSLYHHTPCSKTPTQPSPRPARIDNNRRAHKHFSPLRQRIESSAILDLHPLDATAFICPFVVPRRR